VIGPWRANAAQQRGFALRESTRAEKTVEIGVDLDQYATCCTMAGGEHDTVGEDDEGLVGLVDQTRMSETFLNLFD